MATYRIPEGELSLAHAAKTSGEHFAVRQENSSHGPGALMGLVLLLSARHTIIHRNTAHIHSKLSSQILLGSSKHINIHLRKTKARETFSPCNAETFILNSLQIKAI